jgi:class 3 adenylate cyclase/tetratricopeptide (TPR) repeat protein
VAGLPEGQLAQALGEAVSRHMIVQDPSATGFSFRHALLREAVYADLLPGRRRSLHVALARALSEHPELGGLRAGSAAELAHHWYAADDLGEALSTSVRAGMEAQAVHAHAEALLHYDRALDFWDRAAGADPPADRLTVLRRAADAANLSGDSQRAMALARDALAIVDEGANPAIAALVRERLGRYTWAAGREEDALREYRRAVELMPADPPSRDRALVLAAEGQALMLIGRAAESAIRCMEAIEIAKRVGARAVEANALNTVSANCSGDGDFEQAVDAASRARGIARQLVDVEEVGRSYVNGSDALDQAGRIEESIALAREGIELVGKLGIDRLVGDFLRAEITARLFRTGRWVEADKHLLELSERAPTGLADALLHLNRGFLEAERGEFDAATRDIDRAERLSSGMRGAMWHAPNWAARATMELWMGRPGAAATTIRQGLAPDEESARIFFTARLYDLGARAAADITRQVPDDDRLRVRQETAARALLQRLDGLLQELKHAAPSVLASRAACAAELSRIGGGDASAWADAERLWEKTGDSYQAAYARFRRAEALITSGPDVRGAHDLLRDAHAVAAKLSARPLMSEIETLARRSGWDLVASDGVARGAEPDLATELPAQTSGVTAVLFSDIENSTLLLDRLGDEAFMQLLAQHNRVVRGQIALHGGREIKTVGDSFMVAFGQPRRALACAVAIQRAVMDIKPVIRVRIGLHAGETLYQQDDLFGRHVVIAARVAALAGGGEILATSLIRELAEGATGLRFGPRREHTLKGLSGTQSVYSLQWSGATETLG